MTFLAGLKGVYVLKLDGENYYVGKSSMDLEHRIRSHYHKDYPRDKLYTEQDSHTPLWVGEHDEVELINVIPLEYSLEDIEMRKAEKHIALLYMEKHGWEKVRGGPWGHPELKNPPNSLLERRGPEIFWEENE